jgi:hypothetical protein
MTITHVDRERERERERVEKDATKQKKRIVQLNVMTKSIRPACVYGKDPSLLLLLLLQAV